MEKKPLTNEKISKRFKSQFDLVNYAIKLTTSKIKSGRPSRVKTDKQSEAAIVLEEICQNKDQLEVVVPEEKTINGTDKLD